VDEPLDHSRGRDAGQGVVRESNDVVQRLAQLGRHRCQLGHPFSQAGTQTRARRGEQRYKHAVDAGEHGGVAVQCIKDLVGDAELVVYVA
jgi:hypothetical protein